MLLSKRKYGRLGIAEFDPQDFPELMSFIEKHKQTLIDLQICTDLELKPQQYFRMLNMMSENLKTLSTTDIPVEVADEGQIVFPSLDEWTWRGCERFMFVSWQTPRLKKFVYQKTHKYYSRATSDVTNMVSFLRVQPQLRNLKIMNSMELVEILAAARLAPFPFNLKNLTITVLPMRYTLYGPFLEHHRQSLRVFTLRHAILRNDDFRRILSLPLEELAFRGCKFYNLETTNLQSQTIRKLSFVMEEVVFSTYKMNRIIESCPMVETLSLEGGGISKSLSRWIASSLPNLKNLELSRTRFNFKPTGDERYASLEKLSAYNVEAQSLKCFIDENPQLKFVKIKDDDITEDEISFFEIPRVQIFVIVNLMIHLNIYFGNF